MKEGHIGEIERRPQATPGRIMQFAWGFAPPLIIEAAIRRHVFDALDGGSKTAEQVSAETDNPARVCLP